MTHAHVRAASVAALLLAAALARAAVPAAADAHVPFVEPVRPSDTGTTAEPPFPAAVELPPPSVSRAVYGYLAPGRAYDVYTFRVAAPVSTRIELIVPERSGQKDFRPGLILFDGARRASDDPGGERSLFLEPFSLSRFWEGAGLDVQLAPGDTYELVVVPGTGSVDHGSYVIVFGGAEAFTGQDVRETFRVLPKIWLGSWSGAPPRTSALVVVGVVVAALVGLVALGVTLTIRRSRASP